MSKDHNYFVYIAECVDGLYYTGITNNIERRLFEHNEGRDIKSFTYTRRPVVLRYNQVFTEVKQAISREKQLKGWSRKKKEALFEDNWEKIRELSNSKNKSSTGSD